MDRKSSESPNAVNFPLSSETSDANAVKRESDLDAFLQGTLSNPGSALDLTMGESFGNVHAPTPGQITSIPFGATSQPRGAGDTTQISSFSSGGSSPPSSLPSHVTSPSSHDSVPPSFAPPSSLATALTGASMAPSASIKLETDSPSGFPQFSTGMEYGTPVNGHNSDFSTVHKSESSAYTSPVSATGTSRSPPGPEIGHDPHLHVITSHVKDLSLSVNATRQACQDGDVDRASEVLADIIRKASHTKSLLDATRFADRASSSEHTSPRKFSFNQNATAAPNLITSMPNIPQFAIPVTNLQHTRTPSTGELDGMSDLQGSSDISRKRCLSSIPAEDRVVKAPKKEAPEIDFSHGMSGISPMNLGPPNGHLSMAVDPSYATHHLQPQTMANAGLNGVGTSSTSSFAPQSQSPDHSLPPLSYPSGFDSAPPTLSHPNPGFLSAGGAASRSAWSEGADTLPTLSQVQSLAAYNGLSDQSANVASRPILPLPQFNTGFGVQQMPPFNPPSAITPSVTEDMTGRASGSGSIPGMVPDPFAFLNAPGADARTYEAIDQYSHTNNSGTRPASPVDESGEDSYSDGDGNIGSYDAYGMSGAAAAERPIGHGQEIPPEYREEVDRIFFDYLQKICSNLDATDSKGEPIHQTLMMKKMQRLDESPDFRPFKFRIQAFTNGFLEELAKQGYHEERLPMKKVRNYLWLQPYISRFNEDGKKAKSKGNHVWNIEAKKDTSAGPGKWVFKAFKRQIAGIPPPVAYVGLRWLWTPRVWDPWGTLQKNTPVTWSSPQLPDWLSWQDGTLTGLTPANATDSKIFVEAIIKLDGQEELLTMEFRLTIAPVSTVTSKLPHSRRPSTNGDFTPRRVQSDSAVPQAEGGGSAPMYQQPSGLAPAPAPASGSSKVIQVLEGAINLVKHESHARMSQPELDSLMKQREVLEMSASAMKHDIPQTRPSIEAAAQSLVVHAMNRVKAVTLSAHNIPVSQVSCATKDAIAYAVNLVGTGTSDVTVLNTADQLLSVTSNQLLTQQH